MASRDHMRIPGVAVVEVHAEAIVVELDRVCCKLSHRRAVPEGTAFHRRVDLTHHCLTVVAVDDVKV